MTILRMITNTLCIVLGLLIFVLVWNWLVTVTDMGRIEGFIAPRRTDIGYIAEGWNEEPGFERDLRYTETFTDLQGLGIATDFCRAVQHNDNPSSLHIACAVGRRDGMDTLEYRSRTRKEGFQFSRDDYWRKSEKTGRMDYCRIVRDPITDEFIPMCAIAGPDGFRKQEERDIAPPSHIQKLLRAYEGIMAWFRWIDDENDVTKQMTVVPGSGTPEFPSLLKPEVSRGVQLNRKGTDRKRDSLRWGQTIEPREINAFSFWVYWDSFNEQRATVMECSNGGGRKDRVWLGVEGGTSLLNGNGIGQWVFEIWDDEQRIMRLEAPPASAKTGQWQHILLTTENQTKWWAPWSLWIDGKMVSQIEEGRRIPAETLTENRLGGPEFSGCLMDFRIYHRGLNQEEIQETMEWAKSKLHPSP